MIFKRWRYRKQKTFELGRIKDDKVTGAVTGRFKGQTLSHNEPLRRKKVEEHIQ